MLMVVYYKDGERVIGKMEGNSPFVPSVGDKVICVDSNDKRAVGVVQERIMVIDEKDWGGAGIVVQLNNVKYYEP